VRQSAVGFVSSQSEIIATISSNTGTTPCCRESSSNSGAGFVFLTRAIECGRCLQNPLTCTQQNCKPLTALVLSAAVQRQLLQSTSHREIRAVGQCCSGEAHCLVAACGCSTIAAVLHFKNAYMQVNTLTVCRGTCCCCCATAALLLLQVRIFLCDRCYCCCRTVTKMSYQASHSCIKQDLHQVVPCSLRTQASDADGNCKEAEVVQAQRKKDVY
jgi:hypothetical protein